MQPFNIGYVVRLNSGGPAMAVIGVSTEIIITTWGADLCETRISAFNIKTITKVD